ncbi:MAG: hypothetical protein AMXMBFR13_46280 [Phycisphaerae bacterium]
MAITPINLVRVSNNLRTSALLESLRRNTLDLFLEQNRLATGNKLNAPSEHPVLASRALRLSEVLERQDQVLANIRHADSFLSATDTAVGEANDLLIQAHTLASEAVNSSFDQQQRDATAELILGIVNQLVSVGNRKFGDVYLFGGQRTDSPPFTQFTGGVEFRGDTRGLTSKVDLQQNAIINISGAELFGATNGQVSGWVDLAPVLQVDTRLADVSGGAGRGVQRGQVRITLDAPATSFVVDLTTAETAGDVIDLMNEAATAAGLTVGPGNQFNAAINAAGNGIDLTTGGGNITVAEVGDGVTARDLGLLGTGAGTLAGGDLQPRLTPTTPIAALFDGAGAVLGPILIENGPHRRSIDLNGATTLQDILNRINSADAGVEARINSAGTGLDIVNLISGARLSVGEDGGNTAELLGIRSLHGATLLSSLNDGRGVTQVDGADLRITASDGSTFDVDVSGAATIQDVLDRINAATGGAVTASLATTGNGLQLTDNVAGPGAMSVSRLNLSAAADDLGIFGTATAGVIAGEDVGTVRVDSIFTALVDLHSALVRGDTAGITSAGERISAQSRHVNRQHGIVGARAQAMNVRLQHTEAAVDTTRALLSDVKDLDYTEAITEFQKAQTTLQANLMTGSRLLQISLMDFLG